MNSSQDPNQNATRQDYANSQERAKLVKLVAEFATSLQRLPNLQTEIECLLTSEQALDYIGLVQRIEPQLQQVSRFLTDVDFLTNELKADAQIDAFIHNALSVMGLQTVDDIYRRFDSLCCQIRQQLEQNTRQPTEQLARYKFDRFIKIGEDGQHLTSDTKNWVALLDTNTHLIWEIKTQNGLHNEDCYFTNIGDGRAYDSSEFVNKVNQEGFAGANDWRLPTIEELEGLFFSIKGVFGEMGDALVVLEKWCVGNNEYLLDAVWNLSVDLGNDVWGIGNEQNTYWSSSLAGDGVYWGYFLSYDFACRCKLTLREDEGYAVRLVRTAQ